MYYINYLNCLPTGCMTTFKQPAKMVKNNKNECGKQGEPERVPKQEAFYIERMIVFKQSLLDSDGDIPELIENH